MSQYQVDVDIRTNSQSVGQAREQLNRMNQQIRQAGQEGNSAGRIMEQSFGGGARSVALLTRNLLGAVGVGLSLVRVVRGIREELTAFNRVGDLELLTGISAESLSNIEARAQGVGLSLETVNTAIQRQRRAIDNAEEGYTRYIRFFDDLNLNVAELARSSPEDSFQAIVNALAQANAEGRNVSNAIRALAGSDPQILKLAGSLEEVNRQLIRAERLGAVIGPQQVELGQSITVAGERTSQAWSGVQRTLANLFGPEVLEASERLASRVEGVATTLNSLQARFNQGGGSILGTLLDDVGGTFDQFNPLRPALRGLVQDFIDDNNLRADSARLSQFVESEFNAAFTETFRDLDVDLSDIVFRDFARINFGPEIEQLLTQGEDGIGEARDIITRELDRYFETIRKSVEDGQRDFLDLNELATFVRGPDGGAELLLGIGLGDARNDLTELVDELRSIRQRELDDAREAFEERLALQEREANSFRDLARGRVAAAEIYTQVADSTERALALEILAIEQRADREREILRDNISELEGNAAQRLDVQQELARAELLITQQAEIQKTEARQRFQEQRDAQAQRELEAAQEIGRRELQIYQELADELVLFTRLSEEVSGNRIQSQDELRNRLDAERQLRSTLLALQQLGVEYDEAQVAAIQQRIRDLNEEINLQLRQQQELARFIDSTVRGVGDVLANSIVDGLQTGRLAFRDFVNDIANTLIRSGIRELVAQIFSPQGNASQSIAASFIGSLFGGFAGGGTSTTTDFGPTPSGAIGTAPWRLAKGGVVNSPTSVMGGQGLIGEAGPEAVLPLRRTSSGDLGVAATGGGSTVNVNTTVNVNGDSGDPRRTADLAAQSVERVVTSKVYEILARESRTGNLLSRPVQRF